MEIIKYEIQKGDTLESIAAKEHISVEELVGFHNENCGLTHMIIGSEIPLQLNFVLLEKDRSQHNSPDHQGFENQCRYRCEQVNTSKFNGVLEHYVEQKFQYLLKLNFSERKGYVKLEDYNKSISPAIIADTFDFIEATEKIKNNVVFRLDRTGKIDEILNAEEINSAWNVFKKENLHSLSFIKKLQEVNPSAIRELINIGDQQFSVVANNDEEYWRNFFYFCCFDQYLFSSDWEKRDFDLISTIVPPLIIPLKIRYDKVDESNGMVTIRKVAEYTVSDDLKKQIIKRYDELHKNVVGYSFTDYKLIFRATVEIDSETRILKTGKVVLKEDIADNIENECVFTVKKLENFVP